MLTVEEARAIVLSLVAPLPTEDVPVDDALDRVLAEDVTTRTDVPPFASSAMDGYALRAGPARTLTLVGESSAGHPFDGELTGDTAIRISTGALVPPSADAVLQQELCTATDTTVTLQQDVAPGRNVRHAGEDVPQGTTVLTAGSTLGPAELGVAVSAGRSHLTVRRRPAVAIVATGDELQAPGATLEPGQIHESNGLTLAALAQRDGAAIADRRLVADRLDATIEAIGATIARADVVLLSGGVSVGPHDHVKPALDHHGVTEHFWRVKLRPGKPTWCGTKDGTLVLGLPGNPVSTMVTYLLFARPALKQLQGLDPRPPHRPATLTAPVDRNPDRDEMVRVRLNDDGTVTPTGDQGSHRLTSMLGAGGLARIPAGTGQATHADVELL